MTSKNCNWNLLHTRGNLFLITLPSVYSDFELEIGMNSLFLLMIV